MPIRLRLRLREGRGSAPPPRERLYSILLVCPYLLYALRQRGDVSAACDIGGGASRGAPRLSGAAPPRFRGATHRRTRPDTDTHDDARWLPRLGRVEH
eukprot:gene5831-17298_t